MGIMTISKFLLPAFAILLACSGCAIQSSSSNQMEGDINYSSPNYRTDASPDPMAAPIAAAPEAAPLQDAAASEEKKVWSGLVEVIATATGGNSKARTMDVRAEAKADWGVNRFKAYARHEWTETQDDTGDMERSRNRQTAGAKFTHDYTERFYSYAKQDFERDEFQDLKLRSTTTVGAGRKLIVSDAHKLNAEVGIGYERSDYYQDDTRDDLIGRLGEDYSWIITETWSFLQTLDLISNLLEIDDEFRTIFTAELRNQMAENLYVAVGVEHRYDAEPSRDDFGVRIKRQDWMAFLKVGWTF
jgi:putative salt-induced outer membrane protein YdiY